jgi:putative CocE/NonD family hydrolase
MGENRWRAGDEWPLPGTEPTRYYLHNGGAANTSDGDGRLALSAPGAEPPDQYTYDPHDPVTSLGGAGLAGDVLTPQNPIEGRAHVLVYTTDVLEDDVDVTGEISATVYAAASATDTDRAVQLMDVYPGGQLRLLTRGFEQATLGQEVAQDRRGPFGHGVHDRHGFCCHGRPIVTSANPPHRSTFSSPPTYTVTAAPWSATAPLSPRSEKLRS